MISRWQWLLLKLTRRLWIRAALFSLLAVVTALLSTALGPFIPGELPEIVGADAVDNILEILASSLLAVTTFSLTVMVAAYGAATNHVTPRATKLLMQDSTTQNVLSTFIGSFLFSLVGIIALNAGVYGDAGRVVLFAVTLLVVILIVATIIRWIDYLARLGRVGETTDRVEQAALRALTDRMKNPGLGGNVLTDWATQVPRSAWPVYAHTIGYVQYIDMEALSRNAEKTDLSIYVASIPGAFVHPGRPLAWLEHAEEGGQGADEVRAAFAIGPERSFDQDPRFGLSVLAEIASRALSPAVNDPGTAIDVLGRAVRILSSWGQPESRPADGEVSCPRVWIPSISAHDLLDDVFAPIARDGAAIFEVQIRLQKALLALHATGDDALCRAAVRHSRMALERAEPALALEEEKEALRQVAAEFAASRSVHGDAIVRA